MAYCEKCGKKISKNATFCGNCGRNPKKHYEGNQITGGNGSNSIIIIGVLLLVLGVFAGAFTSSQSHLWGLFTTSSTPYSSYMMPLLVGGIVLIIVAVLMGRKENGWKEI